jgi:hypothetical protein
MTADQYRRQALEAQRQAARAPDAILKAGFERLAHYWLTLAEQAEWLKRRYGTPISVEIFRAESEARAAATVDPA